MGKRKVSSTPIKVYESTHERVRLAAGILGTTQAEMVDKAMDEYVARHPEDFALGLKRAREALFEGPVAAAAYLLDEDPEALQRVAGPEDAKPVRARRAVRPTPTEDPR